MDCAVIDEELRTFASRILRILNVITGTKVSVFPKAVGTGEGL